MRTYRFLQELSPDEQDRLRALSGEFLERKEFHGTQGLEVTDAMALAIAAQACLPLLYLDPQELPLAVQAWYGDFVGIVLHPDEVLADREAMDEAGVVHRYQEVLSGEAMEQGPVMVNWHDVARADDTAQEGYNVVIHEFAHKLDMRNGQIDGCPALPRGFLGTRGLAAARAHWLGILNPAYEAFREQVIIAERFGGEIPWMDAYGAESLPEFFAVACEAYFVQRERFTSEFPALSSLFDAFFRPAQPSHA